MLFGYARVSTQQQTVDRQIDALLTRGVLAENIRTEKMSGTKAYRPELDILRQILRKDDTLVVESLSRLGRSAKDLLVLLDELSRREINLVCLKEDIDMKTVTGKMLINTIAAMSQFERDIIVQRTQEGLASARARGRHGGRPRMDPKAVSKALRMYDSKAHTIREICTIAGMSQGTLYSALKKRGRDTETTPKP